MERPFLRAALLYVGTPLALYGILELGVRIGTRAGETNYHNTYVRMVYGELASLKTSIDSGDIDLIRKEAQHLDELMLSIGNREAFKEVVGRCGDLATTPE